MNIEQSIEQSIEQRNLAEDLRSAYDEARTLHDTLKTCEQSYAKFCGNLTPEQDEVLSDIHKANLSLAQDIYFIRCAVRNLCVKYSISLS